MAAASRRPRSAAVSGSSQRRATTAWVRRSSSGASSRKAQGLAFRISSASGDGSLRSRATTSTPPASRRASSASRASTSMASVRQSRSVSSTSGWSGTSRSPSMFSRQASWSGKTTASRSSAWWRWSCGGTRRPPRMRGRARAREAFQRQRTPNIGASSSACTSTSRTVAALRNENTVSSGKLWVGPRESTMASSVAAACSSKLKVRQKRLRSASPQARLRRAPRGEWITRCMSPASSKKRSATSVSSLGSTPRAACAAAR